MRRSSLGIRREAAKRDYAPLMSPHRRSIRPSILLLALSAALAFVSAACQSEFPNRIDVKFRDASGIQSGDRVLSAGLAVGEVGLPELSGGKAMVPVFVRSLEELPKGGAIFYVTDDPEVAGRKCLKVYKLGSPPEDGEPPEYFGAKGELELRALQIGGALARELIEKF
jgi:hypothetical protein